jgi:hypothetical protein
MRFLILLLIITSTLFATNSSSALGLSQPLQLHTLGWKTNWTRSSINFNELKAGGPKRDGIPPIDYPKFIGAKEASKWIKPQEPVIFVKIDDEVKIYPLQILIWHEIVNDELKGKKIAVTFCPLCNASVVFDRVLNNKEYTFGTSGLLRHSDLVMYDRQTQSLWQQFTGQAIVGDEVGKVLKEIPSSIQSFENVVKFYPFVQVLSKDTGVQRNYGRNPYIGYDRIDQTPFMIDKRQLDDRLLPMERVATLNINNQYKAYAYNKLVNKKVLNDTFENTALVLFFQEGVHSALDRSRIGSSKDVGTLVIYESKVDNTPLSFYYKNGFYDKQTHSKWNIFGQAIEGKLKGKQLKTIPFGTHFWFAWSIFKPQTIKHN